jgi:hypothetical protein
MMRVRVDESAGEHAPARTGHRLVACVLDLADDNT